MICDYIVENFALNNNMINYIMKKNQRRSEDLWVKYLQEQRILEESFKKEMGILKVQVKNLRKDVQNLTKEMEMQKKRVIKLEEIISKKNSEQDKRKKEIITKMNVEQDKRVKEFISKMNLEQEKREKEIFSKLNLEHEKRENAIKDKYEKIINSMEYNYQ